MKTWATKDVYMGWLHIGSWLWESFAFDDDGAHYLGYRHIPPKQPELCRPTRDSAMVLQ